MALNSISFLSCVTWTMMAMATGCSSVKPASNEEVWLYSTQYTVPQANLAAPGSPEQAVNLPTDQPFSGQPNQYYQPIHPVQPNLSGLGAEWDQNAPYVGQAALPPNEPVVLPGSVMVDSVEPSHESKWHHLGDRYHEEFRLALADCGNFYTCNTLVKYLLGLGVTAIPANTAMDEHFHNWYQDDVRSSTTDGIVDVIRPFGRGQYMIPAMFGVATIATCFDDTPTGNVIADWGFRTTRGFLVGAPTLLFTQFLIGSKRPNESDHGSYWAPFSSTHGASGDAFIGAMPWITAAKMTDSPWLKGGFYFLSTVPAWGRLNDDRHYLSQVILGWWIAYLSCDAVVKTERRNETITFAPVVAPDMVGLSVLIQR